MMSYSSAPRSLLLAGAFFGAFTLSAAAQQPATPPAPAPHPPPRAAAAGFAVDRPARRQRGRRQACAGRAAADSGRAGQTADRKAEGAGRLQHRGLCRRHRQRAFAGEGDKGTVFVGSRLVDKVYAIINKDGKRSVKVIASGLYRPNGVAFKNGTLYIAELSKISKIEKIEDNLDSPPKPTMIYDNLPKDEAHGWKFIAIGPDNKLYVPVGSPATTCCMTTPTARSAASISTAAAPR